MSNCQRHVTLKISHSMCVCTGFNINKSDNGLENLKFLRLIPYETFAIKNKLLNAVLWKILISKQLSPRMGKNLVLNISP